MPDLAKATHEQIAYDITVARKAQLALRAHAVIDAANELGDRIDALLDELARRLP